MQMCPILIPEGSVAVYLRNHFAYNKLNPIGSPIDVKEVWNACKDLTNLLKNESMCDYKLDAQPMMERVHFLEKMGFLKYDEKMKTVQIINEKFLFTLQFVGDII